MVMVTDTEEFYDNELQILSLYEIDLTIIIRANFGRDAMPALY